MLKDKCYQIRTTLKLSQKEFAKLIDSNQTEISFIERGFVPAPEKIKAIERLIENGR